VPATCRQTAAGRPGWIREIKHDGYCIIAERDHGRVKLFTRNGYDFADRFPLAAAAIRKLPMRCYLIDGEAIVCDANGLAVLDLLRRLTTWPSAVSIPLTSTATTCGGRP
jgi:bifunctional non-homologous end joining protein LigD